jgi:hypothetical protein
MVPEKNEGALLATSDFGEAEIAMSSTTPSLPSLFGRFTVVLDDHRRLAVTLSQLREMCAVLGVEPVEFGTKRRPGELLADLYVDLSAHFKTEEAEAYFGTVVAERPALSQGIDELKAEHVAMLAAVRDFCVIAEDEQRWRELARPVVLLIERLQAHERRETLLLQEFFTARDETS